MSLPRVAVICDLREENWPSMDLVAEMLLVHLEQDHAATIKATRICPPMRRRLTNAQSANGKVERGRSFNADRFWNRFWDYPRHLRRSRNDFDLFHVVDHSYGQLLHELPPERTIVTCHDLDTFECLLHPDQEPRSIYFRKMMERSLSGFRRAARVTCDSAATRDQLLAHDLIPPERTVVIPNGVHPSYSPKPNPKADAEAEQRIANCELRLANFRTPEIRSQKSEVRDQQSELNHPSSIVHRPSSHLELLHVGSAIPRKRIDVLLRVFARVRESFPNARLLRVGGAFTAEQTALVEELKLRESIVILPHIDRDVLAAVYRRAALVLQPSEREGFGLPVVEAMACGTPVVASDLPVLREVGGDASVYCTMGNVEAWTKTIAELLTERSEQPARWQQRRETGVAQASKFTWAEYARKMVAVYTSVLNGSPVVSGN